MIVTYFRALLLPGLVVAALLAQTRVADADCPVAKGKPMYRVTRTPFPPPPPREAKAFTQTFEVFATGRWTWVGPSSTTAGEMTRETGCISNVAMREIVLAMSKARFKVASGIVTTCAALPIASVKYAALRRGRRVSTEEPCGIPLDKGTAALARCAEEARREQPPPIDQLRAICRGKEP